MNFIRSTQYIKPAQSNGKTIVYMLGYGGRAWQAKRHLKLLQNEGYSVLVLDFVDVLKRHNPQDLLDLMNEVGQLISMRQLVNSDTILVGVSLGGLVCFNLVRRYQVLDKLLIITGGDMTHIPSAHALKKYWHMSRQELGRAWATVNIYSDVGAVTHKHVIMLLPKRDKIIDPNEVSAEIAKHASLNDVTIIPTNGGHLRTIISQTILFPRKTLPLIKRLQEY